MSLRKGWRAHSPKELPGVPAPRNAGLGLPLPTASPALTLWHLVCLSGQECRTSGVLTGPYWFISLFCVSCKAATVAVAVAVAVAAAAATAAAAAAAAG